MASNLDRVWEAARFLVSEHPELTFDQRVEELLRQRSMSWLTSGYSIKSYSGMWALIDRYLASMVLFERARDERTSKEV